MTSHTRWRLALARRIAAQLQHFTAIQAIAAIGSVARGYADAYSDLELLVLWDQAPDADLRHAVMQHLGAAFRYPSIDPGHESALQIGGVPVDVWHTTQAAEDATITTVLEQYSLDLVANNRLEILASCIPLHGLPLLAHYKQRVAAYPEALALRFLETYLPHVHLRQLQLAARRDNPTTYVHILSDIQCSLFIVLLALNTVYFPTFKWLYPTVDGLYVAPANIGTRLRHMVGAPPSQAVADLHAVLQETLNLVEARYPQLDTTYARYGLEQTPRRYDGADPAGSPRDHRT